MRIAAQGLTLELSPVNALDSEDWCRVRVVAQAPPFQGEQVVYLMGANLVHFLNCARAMYNNVGTPAEAVLSCPEPGLELVLSMTSLGGIIGAYKIQGEFVEGGAPTLSGGFQMDQSYLPSMIRDLEDLLSQVGAHET